MILRIKLQKIKRSATRPSSHPPYHIRNGGGKRDRTDDLLLAKQALSQLSYTPVAWWA